jgi:restriction system protein
MNRPDDSAFRPHGGYERLRAFQVATAVYDGTVIFANRFIPRTSRTHDQMVQAARSGRQNIAEGSRAAATSAKSEMELVNWTRASLEELLLDYGDFLRQGKLRTWKKDDEEAIYVRGLSREMKPDDPAAAYNYCFQYADPAVVANSLICLTHQANFLLDRLLSGLERQFAETGGFKERLTKKRLVARDGFKQAEDSPDCPDCGKPMRLRKASKGPNAGHQFRGCTGYPDCKATRNLTQRPERPRPDRRSEQAR